MQSRGIYGQGCRRAAPLSAPQAQGSQRARRQEDVMLQHPFHSLAQAAGSQELLPRTASGFGFDFDMKDPAAPTGWACRPTARQAPALPVDRGSLHSPFPPSALSPQPFPHRIAKVLYLLGVAKATPAGASCRHPHALSRCFPLPGRARAAGRCSLRLPLPGCPLQPRSPPPPLLGRLWEAGSRGRPPPAQRAAYSPSASPAALP